MGDVIIVLIWIFSNGWFLDTDSRITSGVIRECDTARITLNVSVSCSCIAPGRKLQAMVYIPTATMFQVGIDTG